MKRAGDSAGNTVAPLESWSDWVEFAQSQYQRVRSFMAKQFHGDRILWTVAALLGVASVVTVYAAISTLAYRHHGDDLRFLIKHVTLLGFGFAAMWAVHRMKPVWFSNASKVAMPLVIGLLIFTILFAGDLNSARRWIRIPGIGLSFQSSDLAKVVLITWVARMMVVQQDIIDDFRRGVLPILGQILIVCALIMFADFSTAVLLFGVCMLVMFIGGLPWKQALNIGGIVGALGMLGLSAASLMPGLLPRLGTWKARLLGFFGGEGGSDSSQIDFAAFAIHRGGLFPNGPGTGISRNFLPHPYSDMIYAFIIEEWGAIIGGLGLLTLYLIVLFRSVRISSMSTMKFDGLLATGMGLLIATQALINMGVAVRLLPTTGQPMPLVSMGGTSLLFTCIALGMILSVSRFNANSTSGGKRKSRMRQTRHASKRPG